MNWIATAFQWLNLASGWAATIALPVALVLLLTGTLIQNRALMGFSAASALVATVPIRVYAWCLAFLVVFTAYGPWIAIPFGCLGLIPFFSTSAAMLAFYRGQDEIGWMIIVFGVGAMATKYWGALLYMKAASRRPEQ